MCVLCVWREGFPLFGLSLVCYCLFCWFLVLLLFMFYGFVVVRLFVDILSCCWVVFVCLSWFVLFCCYCLLLLCVCVFFLCLSVCLLVALFCVVWFCSCFLLLLLGCCSVLHFWVSFRCCVCLLSGSMWLFFVWLI